MLEPPGDPISCADIPVTAGAPDGDPGDLIDY
jgi:hypothetical protein